MWGITGFSWPGNVDADVFLILYLQPVGDF